MINRLNESQGGGEKKIAMRLKRLVSFSNPVDLNLYPFFLHTNVQRRKRQWLFLRKSATMWNKSEDRSNCLLKRAASALQVVRVDNGARPLPRTKDERDNGGSFFRVN